MYQTPPDIHTVTNTPRHTLKQTHPKTPETPRNIDQHTRRNRETHAEQKNEVLLLLASPLGRGNESCQETRTHTVPDLQSHTHTQTLRHTNTDSESHTERLTLRDSEIASQTETYRHYRQPDTRTYILT